MKFSLEFLLENVLLYFLFVYFSKPLRKLTRWKCSPQGKQACPKLRTDCVLNQNWVFLNEKKKTSIIYWIIENPTAWMVMREWSAKKGKVRERREWHAIFGWVETHQNCVWYGIHLAVSIGFCFDVLFVIDKHIRAPDIRNQFSLLNHKIYFQHLAFCRCQISRLLLHANSTF